MPTRHAQAHSFYRRHSAASIWSRRRRPGPTRLIRLVLGRFFDPTGPREARLTPAGKPPLAVATGRVLRGRGRPRHIVDPTRRMLSGWTRRPAALRQRKALPASLREDKPARPVQLPRQFRRSEITEDPNRLPPQFATSQPIARACSTPVPAPATWRRHLPMLRPVLPGLVIASRSRRPRALSCGARPALSTMRKQV